MGDSDEEIETKIEERVIMSKDKDAIPDEKTIKYHILDVNTIKTTSWKRKRSKTASSTEGDSQKKRTEEGPRKEALPCPTPNSPVCCCCCGGDAACG